MILSWLLWSSWWPFSHIVFIGSSFFTLSITFVNILPPARADLLRTGRANTAMPSQQFACRFERQSIPGSMASTWPSAEALSGYDIVSIELTFLLYSEHDRKGWLKLLIYCSPGILTSYIQSFKVLCLQSFKVLCLLVTHLLNWLILGKLGCPFSVPGS